MMKSGKTARKTTSTGKPARGKAAAPQPATVQDAEIDRLGTMPIGELQRLYAEVVGEPTRCPTRSWLSRKIMEAAVPIVPAADALDLEAVHSQGTGGALDDAAGTELSSDAAPLEPEGVVDATDATTPDSPGTSEAGPKLSELDIPALQALYAEVTGRQTRSVHRGSLIYRIREAQKGHVPIGPRASRLPTHGEIKVLPLRMEANLVDRLDEAWARLGHGSRMDLFRAALGAYLATKGESDLARLLKPEA